MIIRVVFTILTIDREGIANDQIIILYTLRFYYHDKLLSFDKRLLPKQIIQFQEPAQFSFYSRLILLKS